MPLHDDNPLRDGNLTDEEYAATYADGDGACMEYPPGFIEALTKRLDAVQHADRVDG